MGLPNGVHHLAICTKDMKAQIEFFTQVLGMELVALYWMHGVKNTYHGFCKSIYFAGPEDMMLEFSTSEGKAIDEEAWIDPEVVRLNGINEEELERYKHPAAFESQGGKVQNPPVDLNNPPMHFPPGREAIYSMSDEDVTAKLSETTPPVQPKAA